MKTRFFTLVALALALVACNNDNENLNGDPVAAQFTADIAPPPAPANHLDWRRPYRHHRHRQRFPVRQRAFHPENGKLRQKKGHLYRRYKDPYFPRLLSVQRGGRHPRSHDRCHGAAEPACHRLPLCFRSHGRQKQPGSKLHRQNRQRR